MNPQIPPPLLRSWVVDRLAVALYADRRALGLAAADHVSRILAQQLEAQDEVRIVVGSAPSQDEFFAALTAAPARDRVDWRRVVVFHMDEYVGLDATHPQSFRRYQETHFVSKVPLKAFHGIAGEAADPAAACRDYARRVEERPIDLVCLGIGENGHMAFNDPPVADFADPLAAKIVALDPACRQQQVNDGCFPTVEAVPPQAITLTLRVFAEARHLSGVVPAATKAEAVAATLTGPIGPACPATLLRRHASARLFLEPASAARLSL